MIYYGRRRLRFVLCGLLLIGLVSLWGVLLTVPVRLAVYLPSSGLYEKREVTERDIRVVRKSLFGLPTPFMHFTVENLSDSECRISSGRLSTRVKVKKIPVKKVVATYEDELHEGDVLNQDAIVVKAIYEDDTDFLLDEFTVDESPVYDREEDVTVHTAYGDALMHVNSVPAIAFFARYDADYRETDIFDIGKVRADVLFADGLCKKSGKISSSYKGVLTDDDIIISSSVYGDTRLMLYPKGVLDFIPTYEGRIYEGQPFDKDLLHIRASVSGNQAEDVLDFTIDTDCLWDASLVHGSSSSHGNFAFVLEPVFVKSVLGDFVYENGKLAMKHCTFVYTDGTRWEPPLKEIKVVTKVDHLPADGESVEISMRGHIYSVDL